MRSWLLVCLLTPVGAMAAPACDTFQDLEASVPVNNNAHTVQISSHAGDVRITGETGLKTVTARGRACAPDAALLPRFELSGRDKDGKIQIETDIPDWQHGPESPTYMLLDVRVPDNLAVQVEVGSGGLDVRGVNSLEIEDEFGDLLVDGTDGDVTIESRAGEVFLLNIGGNLLLDKGSGETTIRNVKGSVEIPRNASGEIIIEEVGSDVIIRADGNGDITVTRVAGGLTIEQDPSGDINYDEVRGSVQIPERVLREAAEKQEEGKP